MQDAGYVFAGWIGTGAVLTAYVVHLALRTRRADRAPRPSDPPEPRQ